MEPILRRITAKQLVMIEKNCPQIRSRSQELWKSFIIRDFGDRPLPDGQYRKTYVKYFREKEAQLEDASTRLRESMNKFKKEKEARTITSLEVDPLAERVRKRRIMSHGPPGSKMIQKAYQTARSKGALFSSRNMRFGKVGHSPNMRAPVTAPLAGAGSGPGPGSGSASTSSLGSTPLPTSPRNSSMASQTPVKSPSEGREPVSASAIQNKMMRMKERNPYGLFIPRR